MGPRDGLELLHIRKAFAYGRSRHVITGYTTVRSGISSRYDVNNTCGRYAVITLISGPLQPSGHYMYHQVNIQQFYVLPTPRIYVFCVDLRTNSDYFPIQH